MNIDKYLDEMKCIQLQFLEFIEDDENVEENFQNLCFKLENNKIRDNKHQFRLFLHHIASICVNHHRGQNFFGKVERVLQLFKDDIQKFYTNSEIFNIFEGDKRILLFLIEEKMMIFDEYIAKTIINEKYIEKKYPQYFTPEIKTFMNERWFPKYDPNKWLSKWVEDIKEDLPRNFHELRKIGENESYICQLIRNDNIKDFIVNVNQNNISIKAQIEQSIYETNSFLIKKLNESSNKNGVTLIDYAAFFGSIQIIKYLQTQKTEITQSLWLYAIHSQNAELIHFLEDCDVEPSVSYEECFKESIKCNHNDIADYILSNYLQDDDQMPIGTFSKSLKYYNFGFIQKGLINGPSFCLLCKYDYYLLVEDLLTNRIIKINKAIIQNHNFR
ncbi:hypothetical protein M9Y10_027191 [Tritrichomonas musculus]|uniref:DUF3447 domain-containing protein n=1 Tax=Tritrichomonas musculus TaxID=1915356 RepID=A0ABR2H5R5_9EUKA